MVADACYGRRVVQNSCCHVVVLVDFVICVGDRFCAIELSWVELMFVCGVSASFHSVSRRVSLFLTAILVSRFVYICGC